MSFKNENTSAVEKLQSHGNDIFVYVKDSVSVQNQHGLYMIPCIRKGDDTYSISSNVPIPENSLVKVNCRHFGQRVSAKGTSFISHQYTLTIKDPVIIQL